MRTRERTIQQSSVAAMMTIAFTSRMMLPSALRLVRSVATCFFLPQYQTVLRPFPRPLVCVDDPLDRRIPFCPTQIQTYLGFVHLWIKACHFLLRTFGSASLPYIRDFIDGITGLYLAAARVYTICQSTTSRPPSSGNLKLRFVRAVDPHLHCVPSLHVMIVVYTWVRMKTIIGRLNGHASSLSSKRRDFSNEIAYLRREALAITESVLHVKQHSVNCVPAALFALHDLLEEFTLEIGDEFVDALFVSGTLDPEDRVRIGAYMKRQHRRFLAEKEAGNRPATIILDFLKTLGRPVVPAKHGELEKPAPSCLPVS